MSAHEREYAEKIIKENAIAYAIAYVDANIIDQINILQASILAMHKALKMLEIQPEFILVDGDTFRKYGSIPHETVIKGDAKIYSIAAASILAKNSRDKFMIELHDKYPQYGWNSNVGYPTKKHRMAIMEEGICEYHRRTFISNIPRL